MSTIKKQTESNVKEKDVKKEKTIKETVEKSETIKDKKEEKTIIGTVCNCVMLNVRSAPKKDSNVVTIINNNSKILIDKSKSTKDWYKITTENGIIGYCMKDFITIN